MNFYNKKTVATFTLAMLLATVVLPGWAEEADWVKFKGSGFLTLAAGAVLNASTAQNTSGYNCPCYIANYGEAGVYQKGGPNWQADSKLGLQGTAVFGERVALTSQVMLRESGADIEWLYGDLKLSSNLTLQAGRKRLPLFYFSDSQDVGLAYPWAHLPPQMYGWEIVNYNGANLLYKDQWGDWSSGMNVFAGSESVKNSPYWKMYNGKNSQTEARWSGIAGATFNLGNDWLETRLLYLQSSIQNTTISPVFSIGPQTRQKIYGVSFNVDYAQWVVRSEFLYINRKQSYGGDHAQLYGVGRRIGKWLSMATYANYRQSVTADQTQAEAHDTASLLLRYDLTTSSDLKLQFERWQNHAQPQFFAANPHTAVPAGKTNLLSASYDMVF